MRPALLFVSPWLRDGGIERELQVKVPWFKREGYRVEVASWHIADRLAGGPNPVLASFAEHGIPVRRLGAVGPLGLLQRAVRVAARAVTGRFHVVVGHELAGNVVAILASALTAGRLRAIAEIHNESAIYVETATPPALLAVARRLYRRAHRVRAVSDSVRHDAARFLGLDPARIDTIYNTFALARIRELASAADHAALDDLGPFVVGCGRLVKMKGFPDLIQAFARVRQARPLTLVILGDGPERPALLRCAAEHGVAADVRLPGFTPNPFAYFARARAFALSSHFGESFSRVLVEAMACGAPVIASRCRWGPEEVLDGGKYGILYDVGDVDALACGITRLVTDREEASRLVGLARARVADFAEERILPQLERMYLG
jgi:glycosyltransferase involved in cell wall biosynthesis